MKIMKYLKLDKNLIKELDKKAIIITILIISFGLINIYFASSYEYGTQFVNRQFLWSLISLVALYFVIAIDYSIYKKYTAIFYWVSILLLILVLFIGTNTNNATGWFRLGPLSFQPSELAKLATIMMLGKTINDMEGTINNFKNFIKLAIYSIIPAILLLMQPDMGMTMVLFFMVLGVFFISGLNNKVILGGLGSLVLLIVIVWNSGLIHEYQKTRLLAFSNPEASLSDEGYQLKHSIIGIGSGGFLGNRIFSQDRPTEYTSQYVPEVHTDFIFSTVGENFGTFGGVLLLVLYGILICKIVFIGKSSKDMFGTAVSIGIASYFIFAIFQNIGMTIGLMPITGITLPLVSNGGSSLLTTVMSIGLVLNIGMRSKKIA